MFKKALAFIVIVTILMCFAIPAFADEGDTISSEIKATPDQKFVNITKPNGDGLTNKKTYSICGNTALDGVTVELYLQGEDGNYNAYADNDGEYVWAIGSVLMRDITLKKGKNSFILIAYQGERNLDTCQVTKFAIQYEEESVKELIKKKFEDVKSWIGGIFK